MNIEQESLDGGFVVGHGGADAASKPIVAAGYANKAYKGVRVRAATANTVVIYVGPAGVKTTNGYPLPAGEELEIKIDNPSRINVVATPAANSQQTVTLAGQIAGDTFTLTCNGATTDPIAVTANAATVQAALQGLSTIGIGNATVADTAGGPPYTVTFTGALAKVDVNLMTAEGTGTNETQNITITNAEAGDKVVLTFGANSTDALAYDSTSAQIQTALRNLASIGAGNVDVTDGATGWDVEFVGGKAKTDVGAISGVAGKNEVQNIEIIGGAAGDMLTLTYDGGDATPVAYNANTATLQGALDSIAALTGKTVVTGNGPWDVEFIGALAKTDVNMITGVCGRNEQQTVGLPDTVDTGTFTLTYDGDTTAPIAYTATATDVKNALELLDSIEEVAVTGGPGPTADWTVEFKGALARTDVDLITATSACGRNEKQTIVVTDGLAGDTMVLTFGAESTAPLAYDSTSAQVAAALKLLVAIGEGDVTVTDGDPAGWVVEFTNDLGLTDVSAITGVCGRNEKQTITLDGGVSDGTFTLTFGEQTTGNLAYNISVELLLAALTGLSSIGPGNCNVTTGDPSGWVVEFLGTLANTDVGPITGDGTLLVGDVKTVTVAETVKGNLATVTVTETIKGVTSTVTITEAVKGHGATTAVAELASGNEATVTVTETQKGDASCAVTVAKVGDITTGSQYSWIAL